MLVACGNDAVVRLEQFWKAFEPIVVAFWNDADVSLEQD